MRRRRADGAEAPLWIRSRPTISRRDGAARDRCEALTALARRAEAVIVFERLWPPLVWAATLVALFLALSWLGLWQAPPRAARIAGVARSPSRFAVASRRWCGCAGPSAPRRSTASTATPARSHRPASSLDDRLAMPSDDPATAALWALHRERLARRSSVSFPPPRPGMAVARSARAAIRACCWRRSPPRWSPARSATAASPRPSTGATARPLAATARIDAWIDPPAYANKPPILLDLAANRDASQKIVTPGRLGAGGARRRRRVRDTGRRRHRAGRRAKPADASAAAARRPRAPTEKRWTISGDGAVVFRRDGATLGRYEIEATPLGAPTITLLEPPRGNLSGSLTLHYSLADRYGVAGAEAEFAKPAAGAAAAALARPAAEADAAPAEHGERNRRSEHDGRPLRTSVGGRQGRPDDLKATSVSGKVGAGAPTTFTLPQRAFHNPLARALVEQRRELVLDPDHETPRVAKAIDALTIAPELFQTPAGVYLGLRQARAQLADAHGDADLLAVADLLWAMALSSRTATPRRRSATCAPPSRSCARRCSAARATRSCAS